MDTFTNQLAEAVPFEPAVIERREQLRSLVLRALYDYWNRLRGTLPSPPRSAVKPSDIPSLLPHLKILELIDGGASCRVRLAGTAVAEHYERSTTGEIQDDSSQSLIVKRNLQAIRWIAKEHKPLTCYWDTQAIRSFDYRSSEIIWLPLSNDGRTVDQVIASYWMPEKLRKTPADLREI